MYDRPLPYDEPSEKALLGAVILGQLPTLDQVREIVSDPEAFYLEVNRDIWKTIIELADKKIAFDPISINSRLGNVLDPVGGLEYLFKLSNMVPTESYAIQYANMVQENYLRRLKIKQCETNWEMLHDGGNPREIISQSMMEDSRFLSGEKRGQLENINKESADFLAMLDARRGKNGIVGISTGYSDLDKLFGGLEAGYYILGARPSVGKTTFALNLAVKVGVVRNEPVYIFSLEMSKAQLLQKIVSIIARVDSEKFKYPESITEDEWKRLTDGLNKLHNSSIFIDDTPGLKPSEIGIKLRRAKSLYGSGLVLIDYLQLMGADGKFSSRYEIVTDISAKIKGIQKDVNMPIIVLSQLNRAVTNRKNQRPTMADLRESGAIEQDADVIMFLHREDYFGEDGLPIANDNSETELLIEKARMGRIGVVKFNFIKPESRFEQMSFRPAPQHGPKKEMY